VIRFGKYGRKISWIVKRYGKYGRKENWIVIRFGKYGRKISWIIFSLFNLLFFHIFHIFSLFNLLVFHIFQIFPLFNCLFFHIFHIFQFLVFIFTMSFSCAFIVCFARTYSCWFRIFIRKLSVFQVHIVVGSEYSWIFGTYNYMYLQNRQFSNKHSEPTTICFCKTDNKCTAKTHHGYNVIA
jgi:hypothetical protein